MGVLIRIVQNLGEVIRLSLTNTTRPLLGTTLCSGGGKGLRLHTPQKEKQQTKPYTCQKSDFHRHMFSQSTPA
jgi:hypothetical protein